jgi:hypothetical protein
VSRAPVLVSQAPVLVSRAQAQVSRAQAQVPRVQAQVPRVQAQVPRAAFDRWAATAACCTAPWLPTPSAQCWPLSGHAREAISSNTPWRLWQSDGTAARQVFPSAHIVVAIAVDRFNETNS